MQLVAVHGYPLDRRMWEPLAQRGQEGRLGPVTSVFAPDLRGRGTSLRPAAGVHTMALLADDLAEDLEGLDPGGGPLVLAGLSMGGYVLFELLRRHGARLLSRVAAVVFCDTRATADDESGRAKRREAIEAIRKSGITAALQAMLPKLLSPASRGSAAEETARAMILATPPGTACADLAGLATRSEGFDVLSALTKPVLFLVGEDDTLTPPADAEAMAAAATSAPWIGLVTIPRAGHLAPMEQPDEVAGQLRKLLSPRRARE